MRILSTINLLTIMFIYFLSFALSAVSSPISFADSVKSSIIKFNTFCLSSSTDFIFSNVKFIIIYTIRINDITYSLSIKISI